MFVDGERRGTTPATLSDVCEGARTVELRGAEGRLVQRIAVKTGETMRVQGALKPAFALLTAGSGLQAGVSDRRADVERALAGSRQVTVFVPGGREADEALKGQQMPPEWLAFDAGRRPLGGAAALNAAARRDLSTRFARALDVQGIAAISQPSPSSPDLVVALIAAGAGEPDVVAVTPERTDSINRAIARFDYLPSLSRRGIGLLAADVLDVEGLVVVRVDPGSAGDQAGIKPGDVLARADGGAITGSAQLQQLLDSKPPGAAVSVEAHDASGTVRTVQVPVAESPRLMSVSDQGLLFNPISLALRSRLAAAAAGDQPFVRLIVFDQSRDGTVRLSCRRSRAAASACSRPTSSTSTGSSSCGWIPGAPGSRRGSSPATSLVRADGQRCLRQRAAAAAARREAARRAAVAIEAHDATGTARTVQAARRPRARASSPWPIRGCCSIPFRSRCAAAWPPRPPKDQPFVRLNLAVALMRLGDYAAAREQLEAVQLPAGPGISLGHAAVSARARLRRARATRRPRSARSRPRPPAAGS